MLENILSIIKEKVLPKVNVAQAAVKVRNKVKTWDQRTGTKITFFTWLFSIFIVITLNIVLPILSIFFQAVQSILPSLTVGETTVALLGASAITNAINEVRKAKENTLKIRKGSYAYKTMCLGTKITIANWVVCCIIVLSTNIIYPILAIKSAGLAAILPALGISQVTIALLGSSATQTLANEFRKYIENKETAYISKEEAAAVAVAVVPVPVEPVQAAVAPVATVSKKGKKA